MDWNVDWRRACWLFFFSFFCVQVIDLERLRKEGNRLKVNRFEGGKRLGKEPLKRLIFKLRTRDLCQNSAINSVNRNFIELFAQTRSKIRLNPSKFS